MLTGASSHILKICVSGKRRHKNIVHIFVLIFELLLSSPKFPYGPWILFTVVFMEDGLRERAITFYNENSYFQRKLFFSRKQVSCRRNKVSKSSKPKTFLYNFSKDFLKFPLKKWCLVFYNFVSFMSYW